MGHFSITSSGIRFFNKTDFEQYPFERGLKAKPMGVIKVRQIVLD